MSLRHQLVAACCALVLAGCVAPAPSPSTPPRIHLIETVPVETTIGHPGLQSAHAAWVQLIRGAETTLDLEQFYVSRWPGEPLDDILDAIGEAAKRGVRVRFMVDSRMHGTYPATIDSLGTVDGIEVRILPMRDIAGGVQHAKYFVVDGTTLVLGSQNFDWRALKHIHELGVVIRDERVARVFLDVFEMDWAAADPDTARARASAGAQRLRAPHPEAIEVAVTPGDTAVVRPSYSPLEFIPDSSLWDRDAIVHIIDDARSEIVLQLLKYGTHSYGRTDATIDAALRRAAARGVRVMTILSDWQADGTEEMGEYQSLARVPGIEARLSTIPAWSGGYIPFARVDHCKYVVADTAKVWIGTSNWEPGYWFGSRNLGVTIVHRGIAADARRVFESSWSSEYTAPIVPDSAYAPRVHGETPPPGATKYGG